MIAEPLAVAAVIAAAAALAFWLEARYDWGRSVSATLLAILFGSALSNLGLVPSSSPVYDGIFGPVTSLAIAWLLMAVRLSDLREAGPRMLGAFGIGVAGTAIGATAAALALSGAFGAETWKLAGVATGTYSGGSLNFVAVGRELELPASVFAAAAAADNLMTAVWFGATLLVPLWLVRSVPEARGKPALADVSRAAEDAPGTFDVSALLALGLMLIWGADRLAALFPAFPAVLWLTTLALVVGQLPAVRRLSGAMLLGTIALHFFFVLIGIGARVSEIVRVGPEVLYLMAIVVGVHGAVIYGIGRLARLDAEVLSVASQAAIGGPTTAMALAVARRWPALILPGLAAGLLGYAVGNYAGFGIAYLTRAILG